MERTTFSTIEREQKRSDKMFITVCDRCQKPIKDAIEQGEIKIRMDETYVDDYTGKSCTSSRIANVTFCPECSKSFFDWYKNTEGDRNDAQ